MSENMYEILAMSGEPAVLVRKGVIAYANSEARRLLGDCVGLASEGVLGLNPAFTPAHTYLADTSIDGVSYILRVNRVENGRLVFLKRQDGTPVLLNSAFLYALRSSLMTLGVAADRLRLAAEDLRERGMLNELTALTASYYRMMRLSDNASLVRGLFEHQLVLDRHRVDMSLLCHTALDALEDYFPDVPLARDIPDGITLNADPRLVRQLLFNLLSNCLTHAQPRLIRVRLMEGKENVSLTVSDDGVGIAPEQLHMVFERFRYGYELSEMSRGTGLGLTAARGVAQLHGGRLLLESCSDQGTTVQASFRRQDRVDALKEPEELCTMRDILLGLADCLPLSCFEAKYLD